ncbi:MAG: flagellar basal body-associated protein FliL [Gallionellales bacterium RBG_16_56_9]|nr:MAG: flagellar basal body-associated protein FliL [Gallionellales bacterium RBG_16_56_9]
MPRAVPKPAPAAPPPPEPQEEAPRKPRKKLYLVLLLLALLLGGGGAGAWWYWNPAATPAEAVREIPKPPVFAVLEPFTVNLTSGENGEQYLQVALTVQVADQAQVDRIKLYMPQVRSRILLLLSSKTASEIATVEGKKKLSDDIITQVNLPFTPNSEPQSVSDVFFTSFVIQ